jgi:hypothetical protein
MDASFHLLSHSQLVKLHINAYQVTISYRQNVYTLSLPEFRAAILARNWHFRKMTVYSHCPADELLPRTITISIATYR